MKPACQMPKQSHRAVVNLMDNSTIQLWNSELDRLFANVTLTENGDTCYTTTGDLFLDILFKTDYFSEHPEKVKLGNSIVEKVFAMFIRDPRYGVGKRDLGRHLLRQTGASFDEIFYAGRADDLWKMRFEFIDEIKRRIDSGDKYKELYKKWLPRYSSKNSDMARQIAKHWGMSKQEYGHYIKCDCTVENLLSRNREEEIIFEHVPGLAGLKYSKAFKRKCAERYAEYLKKVEEGKSQLHLSTVNCYDIYRNHSIDQDLFFEKYLEDIDLKGSWIPIVDVSGSMGANDSIGKALSIGYTLSRTSTYAPNEFLTFSVRPQLIRVSGKFSQDMLDMDRADWENNTDLSKVMSLLKELKNNYPDWLVILSDMQFDSGSIHSVHELMNHFRAIGAPTKILWWNFRCNTVPEKDSDGNVYLSGYNPRLLQYLQAGFDGKRFLNTLLQAYQMRFHAWEDL